MLNGSIVPFRFYYFLLQAHFELVFGQADSINTFSYRKRIARTALLEQCLSKSDRKIIIVGEGLTTYAR